LGLGHAGHTGLEAESGTAEAAGGGPFGDLDLVLGGDAGGALEEVLEAGGSGFHGLDAAACCAFHDAGSAGACGFGEVGEAELGGSGAEGDAHGGDIGGFDEAACDIAGGLHGLFHLVAASEGAVERVGAGGGGCDPFFEFFLACALEEEIFVIVVVEVVLGDGADFAAFGLGFGLGGGEDIGVDGFADFFAGSEAVHVAGDKLAGGLVAADDIGSHGGAEPSGDIVGVAPGFFGDGLAGGGSAGKEVAGVVEDLVGHVAEGLDESLGSGGGVFEEAGEFAFGFEAGFGLAGGEEFFAGGDVGGVVEDGGDELLVEVVGGELGGLLVEFEFLGGVFAGGVELLDGAHGERRGGRGFGLQGVQFFGGEFSTGQERHSIFRSGD
jgi:hypothetical protein